MQEDVDLLFVGMRVHLCFVCVVFGSDLSFAGVRASLFFVGMGADLFCVGVRADLLYEDVRVHLRFVCTVCGSTSLLCKYKSKYVFCWHEGTSALRV